MGHRFSRTVALVGDETAALRLHSVANAGNTAMPPIILDAEAGQISAELARRGIAAHARVHVRVEVVDNEPPMAAIAQTGKGFDWLADDPDLYSDADLVERAG